MQKKNLKGAVYVYNKTRESFVATNTHVADNYVRRLVGLLGKTSRWASNGSGLWIVPCRGVHTIGMMFPIDLIFLDKEQEVVHLEEHVRPFRISKVSLRSSSVLELPIHTIYRTGTRIGDRLEISHMKHPIAEPVTAIAVMPHEVPQDVPLKLNS